MPCEFFEYRRQQMLPGVLLHMIEAPGPVHLARHVSEPQRLFDNVHHPVPFVNHLAHRDSAEHPHVERLPARAGIKRRAVEIHPPSWSDTPSATRASNRRK